MRKLVIVNGLEQTGKTTLAALIEKLGVSFFPWQDDLILDLLSHSRLKQEADDYLSKEYRKFCAGINSLSTQRTGVSRDHVRRTTGPRINLVKLDKELNLLEGNRFDSIQEKWFAYRNAAQRSILYKKIDTDPNFHVIFPIGAHLSIDIFEQNFDKVYFINITRRFDKWINSRARRYQYTYNIAENKCSEWRTYQPRKMILNHRDFLDYSRNSPHLHIEFESLFGDDQIKTIAKVAEYLGLEMPKLNWKAEQYELMGFLGSYDTTFTTFDDQFDYISSLTQKFLNRLYMKNSISRLDDLKARLLFLYDYYRMRVPLKT